MLNRRTVWRKLKEEGILDSTDAKVIEFVNYMRDNPKKCWVELIPVYRKDFYSTFDTIVPVLVRMEDPVVNSQLLKNLDPAKTRELNTLSSIADTTSPDKDPLTFKRLAKLGNNKLNKRLNARILPVEIKSLLTIRTESVVKTNVVKSTVKEVSVKKAPVKKAPVKKTPVKKTPVKKTPVKKTSVKNVSVKKTPVKKIPAGPKTKKRSVTIKSTSDK